MSVALPFVPPNYDMRTYNEILVEHVYDKITPLREGMTVVDAGASIGIFTIYAAKKVGSSGTVIAFEPEDESYDALVANVEANGLANVIPVKTALWSECGCNKICPSSRLTGSTMFDCPIGQEIKTARLDKILPKLGITHVDVVKIDVEGAAGKLLEGATGFLPYIDNFAIASYHTQENKWEIEKILQNSGFRTKILHRFGFFPFVYATRDNSIAFPTIEGWQIVLIGATLLGGYFVWRRWGKAN